MYEIVVGSPNCLRRLEQVCGFLPQDLCILSRPTKSDPSRATFALAMDRGGRDFPIVIVANWPYSMLRESIPDMIKGVRLLMRIKRRRGDYSSLDPQEILHAMYLWREVCPVISRSWVNRIGARALTGQLTGIPPYSEEANRIYRRCRKLDGELD